MGDHCGWIVVESRQREPRPGDGPDWSDGSSQCVSRSRSLICWLLRSFWSWLDKMSKVLVCYHPGKILWRKRDSCLLRSLLVVRWSAVSGDGNRGFHVVIIRSSGLILAEVAATEAATGNLSDGVSANARLETAGSVKTVEPCSSSRYLKNGRGSSSPESIFPPSRTARLPRQCSAIGHEAFKTSYTFAASSRPILNAA